jgi:hypothetical protein
MPEKELEDLFAKQKTLIDLYTMPTPSYNDLSSCLRLLRFGIVGHKYNFKNNSYRKIVLQISEDLQRLQYQNLTEKTSNWQVIRGATTQKLSRFSGIVFGGTTSNFKKHRRILRRKQKLQENPNDAESCMSQSNRSSLYNKDDIWYPWKCVSLVKQNGISIDLTLSDEK